MIFNQTEKQEKEYLQQVITTIHDTINTTSTSVKEHIDTLQEYKDYLWSNKDIDPHEIRSMRESILNHFALGENVIDKRRRLSKILDIPYFGRIDFQEKKDKSQVSPIYIGIHTFYDLNQKKNLIYDWRAPISSMFYDHELGEAFYSSPAGKINGTISLKRQYRIRKGKMEYMIESSVTVHDDILQKELCSNADNKMKNIVTTIQREQNQIIRNENASVLIIQGVAGSGKTSIALHRIAYLLYTQKGQISSKDILIISPNKVFADYISNVLPELGEETVPETSMGQILSDVIDNKYKHQNFFEQSQYSGAQMFYSPNNTRSAALAEAIRRSVVEQIQPENTRENKQAESGIYLLNHVDVPAVIVECGFISNPEEAELLCDSAYQQKLAAAIVDGVLSFCAAE